MKKYLLFLFILSCGASSAMGQYRAIQSTAGGIASSSSSSISLKLTIGEPFQGLSTTSNADTLITGFYLGETPVFVDTRGPIIFFSDVGGMPVDPLAETPPVNFVQPANEELAIVTQITDRGSGVQEATLFYKEGGMPSYQPVSMSASGAIYSGNINALSVNSKGVEYYIEARDSLDNLSRSPDIGAYGVQVRIDAPGIEQSFQGDTTEAGYRLIAVPFQLTSPSSSNVLADLGNYDNTQWRLFMLKSNYTNFQGNEQYQELTNGTSFTPGSAFWLISRNNWTLSTGQATSLLTTEPFTKTLHAGWNFISNPFNFSIPVQNISLSTGATPDVREYQQGWQNSTSLGPFTGYAIDAGENDNVVLTINPGIGVQGGGKHNAAAPAYVESLDWSIRIKAESNVAADIENRIGVSNDASAGWDPLDRPEPPVIGDFLSVSFPHQEWGKIHTRYEADVRPPPVQGDSWNLDVASGTPQLVQLTFEGIEDVPAHYSIELVDTVNKTSIDLRKRSSYSLQSAGAGTLYPLIVVIGESPYVDDQNEALELIPDGFKLDQNYPNPFNPTTSIRYAVSEPSIITLEVYNSLGQVVSTLVDHESREAGYHIATWNARADDGSPVSSGLYLYRLTVVSTDGSTSYPSTLTRKMMLVK